MADFTVLMQGWYRLNKRSLPWRASKDPYKIWLSEIILQQTRVDQGISYYIKFIERFPNVELLAQASEDEVLNLWQGLGYYSRARNLHYTAKLISKKFQGVFPTTYEDVLSLKGVGEYTAAAICSIAYGLPYAVVDGNVYRVLSRYLGLFTPIDSTHGKKEFKIAANELLDRQNPSAHNQALMELGALICTPKKPNCENCPVNTLCCAREKGLQLELPIKEKKIKIVNRYLNYLVITDGNRVVLNKRIGKGIWEGLYDFVCVEKDNQDPINPDVLVPYVNEGIQKDGVFKHILSHQKLNVVFWVVRSTQYIPKNNEFWADISALEAYPMPQLLIRYMEASAFFRGD
jgi:A/G-specific adenine glycosylase